LRVADEALAEEERMELASLDPALFLPEPEPREVKTTILSVDDHVVEPP